MTRGGQAVRVTDNGVPLWILQPVLTTSDTPERVRAIDELLDEVLKQPVSQPGLSRFVKDARR